MNGYSAGRLLVIKASDRRHIGLQDAIRMRSGADQGSMRSANFTMVMRIRESIRSVSGVDTETIRSRYGVADGSCQVTSAEIHDFTGV